MWICDCFILIAAIFTCTLVRGATNVQLVFGPVVILNKDNIERVDSTILECLDEMLRRVSYGV